MTTASDTPPPSGLDAIVRSLPGKGPAPVDTWNPPYCGDIGLEIRADGSWWYQGTPIGRPALVALFASVLRKDTDGRTYLVTPAEKIDVKVADAHFLAVEMTVTDPGPDQTLSFRTNLGEHVTVDADHPLRFVEQPPTGGLKPYVRVRGRLEALVCRAVYLDLVALATETPDGPTLWSSRLPWPMREAV
jgi:uncharacterized protein